jgi:hypothetical protein
VPLRTLALGGFVVGALDLLDAVVFFGLRSGVRPARIFQSIAAGLLGRAAFSGGAQSAALGVCLHFLIAFLIVCTCYGLSRVIPFMTEHVILSGILFGLGAYVVMNYVVIPLSATTRGAFAWPVFLNGVMIHAFGVGIPAMWFVARAGRHL